MSVTGNISLLNNVYLGDPFCEYKWMNGKVDMAFIMGFWKLLVL